MAFADIIQKLNKVFLPISTVGGLQITNSEFRFLELKFDKGNLFIVKSSSLRLPPGIVESGKVKDRANFIAALKTLHGKLVLNAKKTVNVVLTLPTGDVYAQAFNIPAVSKNNLAEAVELNLQVISPMPIDKTYYSWKVVGDNSKGGSPLELLGVFAERGVISDFRACLEEANFGVAAIEFSSLSMARLLSFYKIINKDSSYLLVKMTKEGLIFMILRNGNLYFDYFHSWEKFASETRGISVDSINEIVYIESQRVLNFYSSHWGGQIKNVILITPALAKEMSDFIKSKYPTFQIYVFASDKENLHGVKGAALRGLISSPLDPDINLMDPEGINVFYQDQIMLFQGFWAKISIAVLAFLLIVSGSTDLFLRSQAEAVKSKVVATSDLLAQAELDSLKAKASTFNNLVDSVAKYKNGYYSLGAIYNKINDAFDSSVVISRFSLQAGDTAGSIEGLSNDQASVINFKNRLAAVPGISGVNLPISNINPQPNGQIFFFLTFSFQKPASKS